MKDLVKQIVRNATVTRPVTQKDDKLIYHFSG